MVLKKRVKRIFLFDNTTIYVHPTWTSITARYGLLCPRIVVKPAGNNFWNNFWGITR